MIASPTRYIDPTALVGAPPRYLQGAVPWEEIVRRSDAVIALPEMIYVGPFATIGIGARLGAGCVIDAYCRVEPFAQLGRDVLVLYRGTVGVDAVVGDRCVIGGSVSERTIIEDDCRSFGRLVHTHADSAAPWDHRDDDEPSPVIRHNSFIGHDALVIGGIEIGPRAYVCAGATVTRSVPPFHIAFGVNRLRHYQQWTGRLAANPIFQAPGP